jgi:4-hydroxythreonine-4-phosphate dehydrogenase
MTLPKIGISLGDPGGIGPEVTLKALASRNSIPKAQYVLFGSSLIVAEEKKSLSSTLNFQTLEKLESAGSPWLSLVEVKNPLSSLKKGFPSKKNGEASFHFFQEAVEAAQKGKIHSLVTAPISKKSWELAGLKWRGHTDYLSRIYPQAIMSFWSTNIKVALFSSHLPLKTAIEKIKQENLLDFFLSLNQCLERIWPGKYHLQVAGLNPHAGEDGFLGSEEIQEIIPAVRKAQEKGVKISGPHAPDVIFRESLNKPDEIVIALFHDQGLIPFKLEAFEKGVNLTLGLPFVRTSPDHGTAFDIAGRGKANPQSMIEALKLAHDLSSAFRPSS